MKKGKLILDIVATLAVLSLPGCIITLVDGWNTLTLVEKYYWIFCTMGGIWAFYNFINKKEE